MEDLQKVCDLFTDTLRETRNLRELKKLYYDKSTETVTATFECGGIKIANVDLYKSKGTLFDVLDDKTIIPPFNAIDGLGDVVAKNIEAEAKKHPFISIEDFQNRCKVSTTLVDKMKTMGLFKDMPETSQLSLF